MGLLNPYVQGQIGGVQAGSGLYVTNRGLNTLPVFLQPVLTWVSWVVQVWRAASGLKWKKQTGQEFL